MDAIWAEADEAIATARAEAKKAAEDEFGANFFQGYSDLKRRVALAHPEWDLSTFSGVDLDYWDVEASAEREVPVAGVGSDAARTFGGADAAEEDDLVVVDDHPAV